jgi:hypothetical protein
MEPGVLTLSNELQVRGIVLGSLAPEMLAEARKSTIPIVITEGIGSAPMSTPLFHLLTANNGREACISGRMREGGNIAQPEVFIPLPVAEVSASSRVNAPTPLAVGMQVRLLRAPYAGAVGTVTDLPEFARRIATGARVRGAEVKLDSVDTLVFVPLSNLEVIRSI